MAVWSWLTNGRSWGLAHREDVKREGNCSAGELQRMDRYAETFQPQLSDPFASFV